MSKLIYKRVVIKDHPYAPKDYRLKLHRVVMEKHLGRYLKPEEVVHHRDRNHLNNKISNLKLLPNEGEHTKIHRQALEEAKRQKKKRWLEQELNEEQKQVLTNIDLSTKLCNVCNTEKSLSCFHKDKSKPYGVASACKTCRSITEKSRYNSRFK